MFSVSVKVIFFRQLYAMKHQWLMTLLNVIYTGLCLMVIYSNSRNIPDDKDDNLMSNVFGETNSNGGSNPLVILVTPNDSKAQELITRAYHNLERESINASQFNVHLNFTKDNEHMHQALERSTRPSIAVEFSEIAPTKLEYTLLPGIAPRSRDSKIDQPLKNVLKSNDQSSRGLLQLQAAIDAAYMQLYFPEREHLRLRRFPNFLLADEGRMASFSDTIKIFTVAMMVPYSLLFTMSLFAQHVISDKLSGVRELLCVNGVPRWMVNAGWLISYCLFGLFVAVLQLVFVVFPTDSPPLKYISPPVLFVLFIVYGWTALVFVNVIANLFTSQLTAVLLMNLYWMVSTIAGVIIVGQNYLAERLVAQGFLSIVPNFGIVLFFGVLMDFYKVKTELSFANIFLSPGNNISAGLVLLMMLIGVVIFLAIAVYLDVVKPGPFGRARPWYLFKRKVQATKDNEGLTVDSSFYQSVDGFEAVGLECVNIVKTFGTHKALNNVNLTIMKNGVTVLLGHNGAGKTTLFSILCGMFSPTSGEVYTDEYSVFEGNNISEFRKVLGYCPQENLVMNDLSAQEHLIVFGMLKGLTKSEANKCSDKWTRMFGMYDLRHTQAKKLSGGTKRKLCLAIAMTGKPQYLLLDEPSAGMDIESTRKLWDIVLEEKGKCTVIITTHNMDEAEVLGDRIAILTHGQIKCFGDITFLKKSLDSGYRLNCATNKNTENVIKVVKRAIRGASVLYKTTRSVTFDLPSNQINNIPDLLRGLEKEFGESVSSTLAPGTLDDVFIKVQKDVGVKINVEELPAIPDDEMRRSWCNFVDLFLKRVNWMLSKRIIAILILVVLLPNAALIAGLYFFYDFFTPWSRPIDSLARFSEPSGTYALLSNQHDNVSKSLRSELSKVGITFKETSEDLNNALLDLAQRNVFEYSSKVLFAYESQDSKTPTAYFNRLDHPIAYSALVNSLLQGKSKIVTHHAGWHPRDFNEAAKLRCPMNVDDVKLVAVMFFFIVGIFYLVASGYFVLFPHAERTTLFKHLQLMTGLLPAAYWIVNLAFDLLIYICCCAISAVIIAIMDSEKELFSESTVFGAIILTLFLYSLSSILLSYIGSFFFRSPTTSIIVIMLGSMLLSIGFCVLSLEQKVSFEWIFFLPWPILWNALHKTILWATSKRDCDKCSNPRGCDYVKENDLQRELNLEFFCFGGISVVYFLILLCLDHGLGRQSMGLLKRVLYGKIEDTNDEVDSQVAMEEKRVDSLELKGKDDWPELVCEGLGKKYSCNKTVVHNVTFIVEQGECFGLVGVNGAGKTTTFGMLSALVYPTKGTAVIEGRWKVTNCNYNYIKRVGYCPQYEGILKELSARTIIKLFGRLGGVPRRRIGPLVDNWINALDMVEIAKRPCGHYSGGNKRKLSLAMALIGNPRVVLLDEPTAGVDPVVRRKIWEILTTSLEKHGRTIILTSHTMSECEAICDRLTIMVKGAMKCLGSIPALKKTFGKSFILEVKLSPKATTSQLESIQTKIETQFAGYISLHDTQLSRLVFLLNADNIKMYDLFGTMLRIKSDNAIIEDFNVSETPLEQVFLMFAQDKN